MSTASLSKALDAILSIVRGICTTLMAAFVIIVLVSVFFRYVLNDSIIWSEQVSRYLFIWMIMLAMPILYREKANVAFDMLLNSFEDRKQRGVRLVFDFIMVFFGTFMAVQAVGYMERLGGNILEGIGIPQWMVYISQPIGGFLLAFVALESALLRLRLRSRANGSATGGQG